MKISYTWLNTYFKRGLLGGLPRPARLAELFNAHAFEVEGMEKAGGDTVLDVKVLPDRAHYALSHLGIAREAAAITGKRLIPHLVPEVSVAPDVAKVAVNVEDRELCRRYMARRIENVTVGESPKWLRARLEAIGQRSINSVVDATNFVMFDLGQPLHAFDADKVQGPITIRRARAGEEIKLLDDREIELRESDLLIADDAGPLVIAGVKGGKRAEVTADTKNIIIESANFEPTAVRRTSTRYGIRNDSSKRFENEITPVLAEEAMGQITPFILELSPGARAGAVTDVYPKPVSSWSIAVDPAHMNAVTGLSLSAVEMTDILRRLRCVVDESDGHLTVTPPLDRLDLVIPEDIADELSRMYGYNRLPSQALPDVPLVPVDKMFYWAEKIKSTLISQGFSEVLLYTLMPKGSFEISYPLASDKAALRESIVPKLSESLAANALNADLLGLNIIKIFEIGKVFPKSGEKTVLCIGVSQVKNKKGVTDPVLLEEALKALHKALGIPDETSVEFIQSNGAIAEIDLDAFIAKLPEPGVLSDLGFAPLSRDIRYRPFSPYPYIVRDIALFVPTQTSDSDVSDAIRSAAVRTAGDLLVKGPDLFDRFEKDGRVSYAFRLIFQSFDRTLSDDEANGFMDPVYASVKSRGWEVR